VTALSSPVRLRRTGEARKRQGRAEQWRSGSSRRRGAPLPFAGKGASCLQGCPCRPRDFRAVLRFPSGSGKGRREPLRSAAAGLPTDAMSRRVSGLGLPPRPLEVACRPFRGPTLSGLFAAGLLSLRETMPERALAAFFPNFLFLTLSRPSLQAWRPPPALGEGFPFLSPAPLPAGPLRAAGHLPG
jgi:hypothetical protein